LLRRKTVEHKYAVNDRIYPKQQPGRMGRIVARNSVALVYRVVFDDGGEEQFTEEGIRLVPVRDNKDENIVLLRQFDKMKADNTPDVSKLQRGNTVLFLDRWGGKVFMNKGLFIEDVGYGVEISVKGHLRTISAESIAAVF
jgi:hypothetical protein